MSNSMTRQHFKLFAQQMRSIRPDVKVRKNSPVYQQWKRGVEYVAFGCSEFNEDFNYQKFYKACGVED